MIAEQEELNVVFSALSDPHRRTMLSQLATGPARVGELAERLPISKPAVSQHLKVLREAGLIEQRPEAQARVCSLRNERLERAQEWIDRNRSIWNDRFDLLEQELALEKESKEQKEQEG